MIDTHKGNVTSVKKKTKRQTCLFYYAIINRPRTPDSSGHGQLIILLFGAVTGRLRPVTFTTGLVQVARRRSSGAEESSFSRSQLYHLQVTLSSSPRSPSSYCFCPGQMVSQRIVEITSNLSFGWVLQTARHAKCCDLYGI